MPTTRGWAGLGAAVALAVLWVAFGEQMLLGAAAFLTLTVAFGTLYVRRIVPRVTVTRTLSPDQVHDGDRALVTVSLVADRALDISILKEAAEGNF